MRNTMTLEDMRKFVEGLNLKGTISVEYFQLGQMDSGSTRCTVTAAVTSVHKDKSTGEVTSATIMVNPEVFFWDDELKADLLHECGHVCNCPYRDYDAFKKKRRNRAMYEYKAHSWALSKSRELGLGEVEEKLKGQLRSWKPAWNINPCRIYAIAARMAEKENVI